MTLLPPKRFSARTSFMGSSCFLMSFLQALASSSSSTSLMVSWRSASLRVALRSTSPATLGWADSSSSIATSRPHSTPRRVRITTELPIVTSSSVGNVNRSVFSIMP